MPKVSIEITAMLEEGTCPQGHKLGDTFEYPEDMGKICPAAFNSIYPYIRVIESGGSFPFFDEPNAAPDSPGGRKTTSGNAVTEENDFQDWLKGPDQIYSIAQIHHRSPSCASARESGLSSAGVNVPTGTSSPLSI